MGAGGKLLALGRQEGMGFCPCSLCSLEEETLTAAQQNSNRG